ncbi:DNA-directed RNA polymerase subunit beta' [Candidatus Hodgkinia cicadicola]|uniref:DNA-directed RNA polymerase subunit n=1 Tax=Candidatus Hodgkinia cicadicola TaxID=573658 RepID=A0ABX4MFW2_9HYPH|nr:DNA-directed RNA polymerase subunit beta' [Candidatus Hodgkinia cicadicola]
MASPETIMSYSYGEVTQTKMFDVKTKKPIEGGLYCERIFGSLNCRDRAIGQRSGRDGFIETFQRSRFGHIQLAVPVVHTWFYRTDPDVLATLIGKPISILKEIVSCDMHLIYKSTSQGHNVGQLIRTNDYLRLCNGVDNTVVLSGGKAILELLSNVNIKQICDKLETRCSSETSVEAVNKLRGKIELIRGLGCNGIKPDWMVLCILPVLPAELRPIIELGEENISTNTSDIYRNILMASDDVLAKLDSIGKGKHVGFEEYMVSLKNLQGSVDMLFGSTDVSDYRSSYNNLGLRGLTTVLKGKKGRFRGALLGRRVDYSGRSVIVPEPSLNLNECQIPKVIAFKLFEPFILSKLMSIFSINSEWLARHTLKTNPDLNERLIGDILKHCPVLLNRAPTLHKLNIQAFWVKLTNKRTIGLHPLTCAGFNADFDGDQMAVHVPLSMEARLEAVLLMFPSNNILHPAHGNPTFLPTKDMILGLYYLSLVSSEESDICFGNYSEVVKALSNEKIKLHSNVRFNLKVNGIMNVVKTTPGRLLISEIIPTKCNIIYDVSMSELTRTEVYHLIEFVYKVCDDETGIKFCERLMHLGFKYATLSGISLAYQELIPSSSKSNILVKMNRSCDDFIKGRNTDVDKSQDYGGCWSGYKMALEQIYLDVDDNIRGSGVNQTSFQMMINSGARGTLSQARQIIGARGPILGFDDEISNKPVFGSYIGGLSLFEFYKLTFTSRKGMVITALNTSSSGYLTRKLVEVSREYVVRQTDCHTDIGIDVGVCDDYRLMRDRIMGRILLDAVMIDNKCILSSNELITDENIHKLLKHSGTSIKIRSPITCLTQNGVCKMCYGLSLNTNTFPPLGESVGILASQSIGEPGTQLTLRTFHGLTSSEKEEDIKPIDRCLTTPCSGFVKIINIACVYSSSGDIIVTNTRCFIIIFGINFKQRINIKRGMKLTTRNNTFIRTGDVIGIQYPDYNCLISLVEGRTLFENVIVNVNAIVIPKTDTNSKKYWFDLRNNTPWLKPIIIRVGNLKFVCSHNDVYLDMAVVEPNLEVRVFDELLVNKMMDIHNFRHNNHEALEPLTKLFENTPSKGCSNIAPVSGNLKLVNTKSNEKVYVLDPNKPSLIPIIYITDGNDVLYGKNIKRGSILSPNDINLSNYLDHNDFNKLIEIFITKVQKMYDSQGVDVNSKHIEMILRLMTNWVLITKSKVRDILEGEEIDWRLIQNYHKNYGDNKTVNFKRILHSINNVASNGSTLFSNIAFQGSIKSLVKAMLVSKYQKLGIKDNIMFGKLTEIGTGFVRKRSEPIPSSPS